jgi:hypothetical protein
MVTRGNTHNQYVALDAEKGIERQVFVPLEENAKKCRPTLHNDAKEEIMDVILNEGPVQNTLHTRISGTLGIGTGRTDMHRGDLRA